MKITIFPFVSYSGHLGLILVRSMDTCLLIIETGFPPWFNYKLDIIQILN
jgi:hypothetical protein